MRLIDADALLKAAELTTEFRQHLASVYDLESLVAGMPTIDAVPVVRCKDCKHWDFGDCYRQELTRPDDFCSYGERKD